LLSQIFWALLLITPLKVIILYNDLEVDRWFATRISIDGRVQIILDACLSELHQAIKKTRLTVERPHPWLASQKYWFIYFIIRMWWTMHKSGHASMCDTFSWKRM
jgi:hypothetical protein